METSSSAPGGCPYCGAGRSHAHAFREGGAHCDLGCDLMGRIEAHGPGLPVSSHTVLSWWIGGLCARAS